MRSVCGLVFLLILPSALWAQREPCLTGADTPDCGIQVVFNPPLKAPDNDIVTVPSELTVDVPLRLKPTKLRVNSGPAGTQVSEFKPLAETAHYKKGKGVAQFRMEINDCPPNGGVLTIDILTSRLPYPIAVNSKPFECRQHTSQ